MRVDTGTASAYAYGNAATATTARARSSSSSGQQQATAGDTVNISGKARSLAAAMKVTSQMTAPIQSIQEPQLTDSQAKSAAVAAAGNSLRKYLNLGAGTGDTSLMAMNISRKNLAGRIDSAIKKAGITLNSDEKISISVDSDNKIVVGGLKDTQKAKKIQEALNTDKKLGNEMRNHAASGKLNEYAKKQEAYEAYLRQNNIDPSTLEDSVDELFTNAGVRSFIVDEYLQANAGLGLADLRLEKGEDGTQVITGMNDQLTTMVAEDAELAATINKILETGTAGASFEVSFEFSNGTIADSATADAAKAKIDGVKAKLMGYWDEEKQEMVPGLIDIFRDKLEAIGGEYEEEFMQALRRGFAVRFDTSGTFELVGMENMSAKLADTLKGLVQQAMDEWAADKSKDGVTRVANMADVAEAYIEQHRFEHGDVDDYKHMVEINFAGAGSHSDVKVVSPDADKARDEANQKIAGELGEQLRSMLGENGIDASGLEMKLDEKGVITVLGDPMDPNMKKAQALLDQFSREAKFEGLPANAENEQERSERMRERREILHGAAKEEESLAAAKSVEGDEDEDAEKKPEPTRAELLGDAWERIFPKNEDKRHFMSSIRAVSTVTKPQYTVHAGNSGDDAEGDAKSLYRELLNGMSGFHDEHRRVSYSLAA